METVTVTRTIDAPAAMVRDVITDLSSFMRAAGFDEVDVDGDLIHLTNRVGFAEIELTVEVVDDPDAALAYEQHEGMFESMRTVYRLDETDGQTRVEATTDFALDLALVGELLDATVVRRQRRRELEAQLDYLESAVA